MIKWLDKKYVERKPTPLKDMDGTPIFVGDIVEFYFDSKAGHSKVPDDDYTRMRDIVAEIDGELYFVCNYGGALAHRHVEYCRVIGTDPELIDT